MRKFISLCLVLSLVCLFASCFGGTQGNGDSNDVGSNQVSISSNKASSEDFFIWEGTAIIGLSEKGLKQKEIVVPASCTEIYAGAFAENETLETVSFENDSIVLWRGVFRNCTSLKNVTLPQNINEIPNGLFF